MDAPPPCTAEPVEAVLFDFHSTLVDQGDTTDWIERAWRHAGRPGDAAEGFGHAALERLAAFADRVWEHARDVDPASERDLDPVRHRSVFISVVGEAPGVDAELAAALYATMLPTWRPYDDAVPVLSALRDRGVRTGLVSNIGIDVRGLLADEGLAELLDAVVLSYELGVVKPHVGIFEEATRRLGVAPERTLMVGDSWRDDAGAAQLGIRTLLLPPTAGPAHGLALVLRLVGG